MATRDFIQQLQSLSPEAVIELFEIKVSPTVTYRFHAGTNDLLGPIKFGSPEVEYAPWPIEADGFSQDSDGNFPRPTLTIANTLGFISALAIDHNDLLGTTIVRIKTFKKFLNASNFAGGVNPTADPLAKFPNETFFIERKTKETRDTVSFELSVPWDTQGIKLPKRQIIATVCTFKYRGEGCGYIGPPIADKKDNFIVTQAQLDDFFAETLTFSPEEYAQDVCGKKLSSCRLRFKRFIKDSTGKPLIIEEGERDEVLNFGGFPGAGRIL